MENAKKMILISPDVLERLHQENSTPTISETVMSSLDKDMHQILRSNISDHDKWSNYQQILQRYLHFAQDQRQPISLPIVENDTMPVVKHVDTKQFIPTSSLKRVDAQHIISSLPTTFQKRGEQLINTIKNDVTWDEQGVVYINGQQVPGSNVIDLISDVIRPRKLSNPAGWEQFADYLKRANVPREYIGNERRLTFINRKHTVEKTTPDKKIINRKGTVEITTPDKKSLLNWTSLYK